MAGTAFNRRDMMRLSATASAGLIVSSQALGQGVDPLGILGELIKDDAAGIKLPPKPLNVMRIVAAILNLERAADARNLPVSSFNFPEAPALTPDSGSIYQSALPRLVTLIERSEAIDPGIAEEAGGLLAEGHATEHVTPDALQPKPVVTQRGSSFAVLKAEYRQLFERATIRPAHSSAITWHKNLLIASKERYEKLAAATKVPWHFIGIIHGLEASYNFRAHLHNGDFPLSKRTRQVPAGRPVVWLPPDDWGSSGRDALTLMRFTNQSDWSLERTLYRLEAYNGFGYRRYGVPSPYLWSFTNRYERGKFVADGRWSATATSRQCGAATLLRALVDAGEVELA